MERPVLFVLAGVNGAGKSSVGGHLLTAQGLAWFNPDEFAREWKQESGCTQQQANAVAWAEGLRRLDAAVASRASFAFETTLGGATIATRLRDAAATHDVEVWFCGLRDVAQHALRVRRRVEEGGHDIPERMIHARFTTARQNLVALMPRVSFLAVYDNSRDAAPGSPVPDPVLVLRMERRRLLFPPDGDVAALHACPDWAKPILEAALQIAEREAALERRPS